MFISSSSLKLYSPAVKAATSLPPPQVFSANYKFSFMDNLSFLSGLTPLMVPGSVMDFCRITDTRMVRTQSRVSFIISLPALPSGGSVWWRLWVCEERQLPKDPRELLPNKSIKHRLLVINTFPFCEFRDNLSQRVHASHLILSESDNKMLHLYQQSDAIWIFCLDGF